VSALSRRSLARRRIGGWDSFHSLRFLLWWQACRLQVPGVFWLCPIRDIGACYTVALAKAGNPRSSLNPNFPRNVALVSVLYTSERPEMTSQ